MAVLPHIRWALAVGSLLGVFVLYSDEMRDLVRTSSLVSSSKPLAQHHISTKEPPFTGTDKGVPPHGNIENSTLDPDKNVVPSQSNSDGSVAPLNRSASVPPKDEEIENKSTEEGQKDAAEPQGSHFNDVDFDDGDLQSISLEFPAGFKAHPNMYSDTYLPRGEPMDDEARQTLTQKWGSWTFVDPKKGSINRPRGDFYSQFDSRDIPRERFPSTAWQTDTEYLHQFLPEAQSLVKRALEAILTEYGHGPDDEPSKTFEERADTFYVELNDDTTLKQFAKKDGSAVDAGGYMNNKAWDGLTRRVLHAIMTQDTFRVVSAGHSATAGHGNLFQQSFTLQIQRILEPVFARLGVTMTAHNIGMGGMGTVQNALGAADLYSDDVDVLIYDAGMTEPEPFNMDVFMRQVILGGKKVPFIWVNQDNGRFFKAELHHFLAQECDADVGVYGLGLRGIPEMTQNDNVNDIAWAARYLKCDADMAIECRLNWYINRCWIDRDDVTPPEHQSKMVGGQAGWHPGNRSHQLQGRLFAFIILRATGNALAKWSEAEGYAMSDTEWHVHEHYRNIQTKLATHETRTPCYATDKIPARVCNLPLRGRSEFSPRLHPYSTSIRSILKGSNIHEQVQPNLYDPPDVWIPDLDLGDVKVVSILENGVGFEPLLGRKNRILRRYQHQQRLKQSHEDAASPITASISPGKGWKSFTRTAPDNCDGSYDSFCGRSAGDTCLFSGHNDNRGGLKFDGLSGWLVMNLEQLRHGFIMLKIEDWHFDLNPQTEGWTCENNECARSLRGNTTETRNGVLSDLDSAPRNSSQARRLAPKPEVPEFCADFQFEFAINGKVTTWDREEWQKREHKPARVVQLWTLLDDPNFTEKPIDVELAIRMKGCGRTKIFQLTHVYWA